MDNFYDEWENAIKPGTSGDILTVMGDFIPKIGLVEWRTELEVMG